MDPEPDITIIVHEPSDPPPVERDDMAEVWRDIMDDDLGDIVMDELGGESGHE